MCPACIGSALVLFTGATSSGGLTAFIARKALRWRRSRAPQARRRRFYPGHPLSLGTVTRQGFLFQRREAAR